MSSSYAPELINTLKGHQWNCSSVDFHPAGDMLVSGSWDKTIRIWDVAEKAPLRVFENDTHSQPITCVKWHPNGVLIASTSADNTTCLWDASNGKKVKVLKEHFGWVLNCSFSPDRTKLATCSWDKTVRLWDPNTGELISTLRGHQKGVWSCSFYPVGHTSALLASAGEDCTARLWDTRSSKVALTLAGGHVDAVYSVAWSPDGTMVATSSSDKTVTIWDPKVGKIAKMLKAHEDTVKQVAFAPTERQGFHLLASVGGYSSILWNPKMTNNNLLAEMSQHGPGKEVETVSISANGKYMATGGRDGLVCVSSIPLFPKEEIERRQQSKAKPQTQSETTKDELSKLANKISRLRTDNPQEEPGVPNEEFLALKAKMTQRHEPDKAPAQPKNPRQPEVSGPSFESKQKFLETRGFGKNPEKEEEKEKTKEKKPFHASNERLYVNTQAEPDSTYEDISSRPRLNTKNPSNPNPAQPSNNNNNNNNNKNTSSSAPPKADSNNNFYGKNNQSKTPDSIPKNPANFRVVASDEHMYENPDEKPNPLSGLRKVGDDRGKSHPMVEHAYTNLNPLAKNNDASKKPNRQTIDDVTSLLAHLRQQTDESAEIIDLSKTAPKPKEVAPPPSVEEKMDQLMAKPINFRRNLSGQTGNK